MTRSSWPVNVAAVSAAFACVTAWDGLGYTFGPSAWSSSPSLAAFATYPGGIRTYGTLALAVSVLLTAGLLRSDLKLLRLGLAGCVLVYTALACTVLGSWVIQGVAAWGGPSKGLGLAVLAALVLRRTPEAGERG